MPSLVLRARMPEYRVVIVKRPLCRVLQMIVVLMPALVSGRAFASSADDAEQACRQAVTASKHGELDRALAELDKAVRLDPQQARYRGLRGTAWIRKGDYAKGIDDLKAAIQRNPGDAGQQYSSQNERPVPEKALQHGRQQVDAMLRDRPAMARYGADADFLRQWAARRFAGASLGEPLDWESEAPLYSDAEHLAPTTDEPGAILVVRYYTDGPHVGAERSFEELWAGAVYELHNIDFARNYVRLHEQAAQGKVSKRAFVADILRDELRAAQQTRAFYVQHYLPWAAQRKLTTDPSLWFADWWPNPHHMLQQYADKSAYPWRPYGRQHDWATFRYRWGQGRLLNALGLLRRMHDERGYETENAEVELWMGRCLLRLDKPQEALEALNEAIRLAPHDPEVYELRSKAYRAVGDVKKAEADAARAKQLK